MNNVLCVCNENSSEPERRYPNVPAGVHVYCQRGRRNSRARVTFEEVGHVLQLRDVVFAKAAVVDKQWKDVVELFACVCRVQLRQLAKHNSPAIIHEQNTQHCQSSVGLPLTNSFLLEYSSESLNKRVIEYSLIPEVL